MSQEPSQGSIRFGLREVLLAVCSGAAALAVSLAAHAGGPDAATIAVVVAGVAVTADLLRDFRLRLDEADLRTQAAIEKAGAAMEQAAGQFRAEVAQRFAQLTTIPEAFGLKPLDQTRAAELVKVVQDAYAFEHR